MTRRQLEKWAATVDWEAEYTCRQCGVHGKGHWVQPQPDGHGALCTDCYNRAVREWREERRRQLAAMPRCEVPGCHRRATYWHPDRSGVGLCGPHWRRAEAAILRQALSHGFLLPGVITVSRERLIQAAQGQLE